MRQFSCVSLGRDHILFSLVSCTTQHVLFHCFLFIFHLLQFALLCNALAIEGKKKVNIKAFKEQKEEEGGWFIVHSVLSDFCSETVCAQRKYILFIRRLFFSTSAYSICQSWLCCMFFCMCYAKRRRQHTNSWAPETLQTKKLRTMHWNEM